MSLQQTRLDLAVDIVGRALEEAMDATVEERLDAFRAAYAAVSALDAGDEDWTIDTLDAAWTLVEDAFSDGGDVEEILEALAVAHRAVVEVASAPPVTPKKPRRDA